MKYKAKKLEIPDEIYNDKLKHVFSKIHIGEYKKGSVEDVIFDMKAHVKKYSLYWTSHLEKIEEWVTKLEKAIK